MSKIKIKLHYYDDIIREYITEDGHINLFGTTFSVKRYESKKGRLIYELKATEEDEHNGCII